jgi:tetratricopeptide (TPR) repeat protein
MGCLGLIPAVGVAQTAPESVNSPDAIAVRGFAVPIYERQPLPEALNTAHAWQIVGMNAVQVSDYPNALAAFDKAVDLSGGNNPEMLEQRGWLHTLRGEYSEAIADLEAAAQQYANQSQYENALNALRIRDFVVLRQANQTELGFTPARTTDG